MTQKIPPYGTTIDERAIRAFLEAYGLRITALENRSGDNALDLTGSIILSGDITSYVTTNDGNPQIRFGSSDTEEFHIQAVFDSGAQTLDYMLFQTDVASTSADKGKFRFNVDGTNILDIDDGGLELTGSITLSGTVDGRDIATDGTTLDTLGTTAPTISTDTAAPSSTPSKVGDVFVNTTGNTVYIAVGTSSSSDWVQVDSTGTGDLWSDPVDSDITMSGYNLIFNTATGLKDANNNEALILTTTASAVNYLNLINSATGNGVQLIAAGDDTNIDLILDGQGSGDVVLSSSNLDVTGNITVSGTVDGRDIATDGTKLDGIEASADVTDEANVVSALNGAAITAATVAATDKLLFQDADDADNLKVETLADLEGILNHDSLAGFVANEHIDWTSTTSNLSTSGTAATGNLTVTGTISVTSTVDGRDIATDGTKLDGIEASADVTDEANVTDALDGATLTDVGTPASGDLILLQDASDSNILKVAQFSEFGGAGAGDAWSDPVDASIVPDTDSTYNIGSGTHYFANAYIDAITTTGNITVGGTVDGRDIATDGTKLDGIEASADVTDEANVTDALDGATLTDVGTPASGDLILLQDASDSNILKVAQYSTFGGGGSTNVGQVIAVQMILK